LEKLQSRESAGAGPDDPAAFVTPVKQLLRGGESAGPPVAAATPDRVTGAERLTELAVLYAHLIEHALLLGLSIELSFLVRLLVAPGGAGPPPAESVLLTSLHNAVFFSVQTLWRLRGLLVCLDAAHLRLLATNGRLVAFHPQLADALRELPARRPCASPPPAAAADGDGERPDSLAFYAELVYRPNFPSDASFHAFRRQHDQLHALLERWRSAAAAGAGHWEPDAVLGDEPRALVALCRHPVNMHHLARLFQAQLLLLAGGGGGGAQEPAELLQQTDRARLQRLSDRFLKPVCVGRSGGRRDFPGAEELFRQLLERADSAEFSAALRDLLASSVLQLDGQTVHLPDSGVQPSTVRAVSERIFRLRLLAKFLGLVTFRGLHADGEIPEQVLTSSIQMRNRLPPPLDLLSCLEGAVRRRQLVITLPWIIEYICMMDRVSVLTSAHQTVFSLLVAMFRALRRAAALTAHNALFLRLQYENLYEIHSHVQNLCEKDHLAAMDRRRMEQLLAEFGRLYVRRGAPPPAAAAADSCDLVRPSLFYVCCPYLAEQKVALQQFRAGRAYQPSPALRKIIPISARPADARTAAARRTQAELEEAFFQSHHPSLRRAAAFTVERLSSALIKLVRGPQLAALTAPLVTPLRQQMTERLRRGEQDFQIKGWLPARLSALVLAQHAALVRQLAAGCRRRAGALVTDALGALLVGEELTEGARRTVHRLTEAGVLSRVNCWINTNLTRDFVQHVLEEQCRAELRRLRRADAAADAPAPLSDLPDRPADVRSPSVCLMDVKDAVCGALSGARLPSPAGLESLLGRVSAVYGQWSRLLPATGRCLQQLSTQLVVTLACSRPELLATPAAQRAVLACWAALGLEPAAQLLAEPVRRQVAAARQPAAADDCLRTLLAAADGQPPQPTPLGAAAGGQPQQPSRRSAGQPEQPSRRSAGQPRRKVAVPPGGGCSAAEETAVGRTRPESAPPEQQRATAAAGGAEQHTTLEDLRLEDTTLEDLRLEDTTLEDLRLEDTTLEDLRLEAARSEDLGAAHPVAEDGGAAGAALGRRLESAAPCWRRRPPLVQLS
ncbi:codanin-1-like, partial [Amphibalanus amphitrite]|uniref:codanin-1-like n=1 Tax=Amphibalanus amphitrite TaxID=1232801 RepID=UPI001C913179